MSAVEYMLCPATSSSANGVPAQCDRGPRSGGRQLGETPGRSHGLLIEVCTFVKEQDETDQPPNKKQKRAALASKDANKMLNVEKGEDGMKI
jgi:hypothetical protein